MTNNNSSNDLYYIFSDKTVAYLNMKDIYPVKVTKTEDTKKICWWYKNTKELQDMIKTFKSDLVIQAYINSLRDTWKAMKAIN